MLPTQTVSTPRAALSDIVSSMGQLSSLGVVSCTLTCTNHSEYAARFKSAKEAQWLSYLFQELDSGVVYTPIPMYVDSSGVVSLVFNPVDHQSNKHIRIAHHYARELTEQRVIVPQRLPSAENLAHGFTKPLPAPIFKAMVQKYVSSTEGKTV